MNFTDRALNLVGLERKSAIPATQKKYTDNYRSPTTSSSHQLPSNNSQPQYKIPFSNGYPALTFVDRLRDKARELAVNNAFFSNYQEILSNMAVGPIGTSLKIDYDEMNDSALFVEAAKRLNRAWKIWTKNPTDSGRHDWVDVQKLLVRGLILDGEVLIKKCGRVEAKIEIEDVAAIDTRLTNLSRHKTGVYTVYGMELNSKLQLKRIHLLDYTNHSVPTGYYGASTSSTAKNADDYIYENIHLFANQIRGIPPMTAGILGLELLAKFDNATLQAISVAALTSIFIQKSAVTGTNPDDEEGDDKDKPPMELNLGLGGLSILEPGMEIKSWDPKNVPLNYTLYRKEIQNLIAAAAHVTPTTLTGDWSNTSYSSSKAATLQDREYYKELQRKLSKVIFQIYTYWLAGQVPYGLTAEEDFRIRYPKITNRTWPFQDVTKELTTYLQGTAMKAIPVEIISNLLGMSIEEWSKMLKEQEALGINPSFGGNQAPPPAADDEEEDEVVKDAAKDDDKK